MIEVVQSDITTLTVDAVVNAANESLMGGGGVDGAIHHAAGPALREFNRALAPCPPGEARISPGFGMPCKWIIHTVGPVWHGGVRGEPDLLRRCYVNCLELAIGKSVESIAFPAISTGAFGFPKEDAAGIAVTVMSGYEPQFRKIICCVFAEEDARIYGEAILRFSKD